MPLVSFPEYLQGLGINPGELARLGTDKLYTALQIYGCATEQDAATYFFKNHVKAWYDSVQKGLRDLLRSHQVDEQTIEKQLELYKQGMLNANAHCTLQLREQGFVAFVQAWLAQAEAEFQLVQLGNSEFVRVLPLPPSVIPISSSFKNAGVACVGTLFFGVTSNGSQRDITMKWNKREAYSGTHSEFKTLLSKQTKKLSAAQEAKYTSSFPRFFTHKTGLNLAQLLTTDRLHAEDSWFLQYGLEFVADVAAAVKARGFQPLPADLHTQAQITPRIEFMTSVTCCSRDPVPTNFYEGCQLLFKALREDLTRTSGADGSNIPMLMYALGPYETQQADLKNLVGYVDAQGEFQLGRQQWRPTP